MAQPNATYEPIKNLVHQYNALRWQDSPNEFQLIGTDKGDLLSQIKSRAKIEEASDEDVLASLSRCGYRPQHNSQGWFIGS